MAASVILFLNRVGKELEPLSGFLLFLLLRFLFLMLGLGNISSRDTDKTQRVRL